MSVTTWPMMKLTSPKYKRPRKERQLSSNPCKRRREESTPNFRLLRLRQAMLPGLVVCQVSSFLLMLVIFIPKVDTRETFSEAPICVFDVRREVTGPVPALLKMNSCPQNANLDCLDLDQYEFDQSEQGIVGSSFIQGKLHANLSFRASDFVLDIIESSHKILFQETPLPYSIENRSSVLIHRRFVQEAVSELLTHGCTREVSVYPRFCNPLHVAVQSS